MNLTETKDGTIIEIYVKTNSQKFEVTVEGGEIVVRCTEEPVKGKVNKELIGELTRLFHTKTDLVSGATSKQKRLLVRNMKENEIEKLLISAQAL